MAGTCTGRGDNGGHCCYIDGTACGFLVEVDGLPRCQLFMEMGTWAKVHRDARWRRSKVGLWFRKTYPGFGCGDWPQNIPNVVGGLCCWSDS